MTTIRYARISIMISRWIGITRCCINSDTSTDPTDAYSVEKSASSHLSVNGLCCVLVSGGIGIPFRKCYATGVKKNPNIWSI